VIEDIAETDEQRAFADAAARCFASCAALSPGEILPLLAQDGFLGMLVPECAGGLGRGLRATLPAARAAGRHLLAFPLVEAMLAAGFAGRVAPDLAEPILSGEGGVTVAWGGEVQVEGGKARGVAACAPGAHTARWLVFRAIRDGCEAAGLIDLGQGGVDIVAADALDLDRVYADLVLDGVPVIALAVGEWRALTDDGAILRAADMLGAAEASFADACAHVSTRRQFGKPLSVQQVVATTLARDHCSLTGAALSIEYAALAADAAQEDASIARDVACAVAQDACVAAAENAIQFHGALGFTAAMPLHRRLRRIQTAADIYNAKTARANLARTLLESWPDPYKDAA